jgi:hypothetical protein
LRDPLRRCSCCWPLMRLRRPVVDLGWTDGGRDQSSKKADCARSLIVARPMHSSYPADKIVVSCDMCRLHRRLDKAAMLEPGGDRLGLPLDDIASRANCRKRKATPDIYVQMRQYLSGVGWAHEGSREVSEMTHQTFAYELEQAADQIADVSPADLQVLLRRAALRLRNAPSLPLDADVDEAVDFLAFEMTLPRVEALQTIIRDWLVSGGRLPVDTMDEGSETDGRA